MRTSQLMNVNPTVSCQEQTLFAIRSSFKTFFFFYNSIVNETIQNMNSSDGDGLYFNLQYLCECFVMPLICIFQD